MLRSCMQCTYRDADMGCAGMHTSISAGKHVMQQACLSLSMRGMHSTSVKLTLSRVGMTMSRRPPRASTSTSRAAITSAATLCSHRQ